MTDELDLASEHEELRRKLARAWRKPAGPAPLKVGGAYRCLFCDTELPPTANGEPGRWCNAECREDWEAQERARRMRACSES